MILTDNPFQNLYLKGVTRLPDQLSCTVPNIPLENLIPILRDKHEMVVNSENRVTTVSVLHRSPSTPSEPR